MISIPWILRDLGKNEYFSKLGKQITIFTRFLDLSYTTVIHL